MLENPFQSHYKALKWGFQMVLERIKSDKYYKHYNGYKKRQKSMRIPKMNQIQKQKPMMSLF